MESRPNRPEALWIEFEVFLIAYKETNPMGGAGALKLSLSCRNTD